MPPWPGVTGAGIHELGSKNMRFVGTLKTWDDDQGMGTIEPQGGGQGLFVRISAFPGDAQMPHVGEALSFEVELSASGRKQAVRVRREADAASSAARSRATARTAVAKAQRRSWMVGTAVAVLLTTVGGLALMRHYEPEASAKFAALNAGLNPEHPPAPVPPAGKAPAKPAAKPSSLNKH